MKINISFMAALGLIFITLKLTNVIAWSWWLVLLPIYLGLAIWLSIVAILFVFTAVAWFLSQIS
jgi:hypothetical protein